MIDWFKEVSVAMHIIVYFLFLSLVPLVTYGAGHSDGFNEGYQECLVDFHHKDKK